MRIRARSFPLRIVRTIGRLALCAAGLAAGSGLRAQQAGPPTPDPRVGLRPGMFDAGEAVWNLNVLSKTLPPDAFVEGVNSDLAFLGSYVFQGNFNGFQVWDIANPAQPALVRGFVCPASQSDVSVYQNLLFVSGEDMSARLDCGEQGVREPVSPDRLRGIRIFDISDIKNPRNVGNVQTCRGSHTHSLLVDPRDAANVYVYVSGSSPVRPAEELAGCVEEGSNTSLFRIEVIKVPLAHPEQAAIVSSPRLFDDLVAPPEHGMAPEEAAALARAKAAGAFVIEIEGEAYQLSPRFVGTLLDSIARANGRPAPTAADSATLREAMPKIFAELTGGAHGAPEDRVGPTQCHDITLYPAVGMAGGACEGYGFLIDIKDPVNPKRVAAVADSNFSYWHSATFDNSGSKILFSDEWGGGAGAKCRATDPKEWGADAIFSIEGGQLRFRSYYKLPAAQTAEENCVAHNGSSIPIPGRDVMVQAWYQGGISVFDWTDASQPQEIAFFDRGPFRTTAHAMAGSWSVYWYNGLIVSSEIARGLDILELAPSAFLTQNEIDAAKTVRFDHYNPQGQQRFVWPPSFPLARAYLDQLERSRGLAADLIAAVRTALAAAERQRGADRRNALMRISTQLEGDVTSARDGAKVRLLAGAARDLGSATR
ncbi:MAG: hypothetical protein EXR95_01660 [Gemmatimonadetes bacterium]|nr:hypothetical protein [Gemmatimonadota bacterium]